MQKGDKFIVIGEVYPPLKIGDVVTFCKHDGTDEIPYRFLIGESSYNNGFWIGDDELSKLIALNDFTDKEKFLYELSGQIPERFL